MSGRILRKFHSPEVLVGYRLVNVLSDLSSLVFVSQDLSLALGSCAHSRNLEFITVHVGVSNLITEEVLLGCLVL